MSSARLAIPPLDVCHRQVSGARDALISAISALDDDITSDAAISAARLAAAVQTALTRLASARIERE